MIALICDNECMTGCLSTPRKLPQTPTSCLRGSPTPAVCSKFMHRYPARNSFSIEMTKLAAERASRACGPERPKVPYSMAEPVTAKPGQGQPGLGGDHQSQIVTLQRSTAHSERGRQCICDLSWSAWVQFQREGFWLVGTNLRSVKCSGCEHLQND